MKKIFLALVFVLLSVSLTEATTRYVAKAGDGGSDANSCAQSANISTPKLTIAAGLACMSGGDTLLIRAGTYPEFDIGPNGPSQSGTQQQPTWIGRYQNETVIIAPTFGRTSFGVGGNTQWITFHGLIADGASSSNDQYIPGVGTCCYGAPGGEPNHIVFDDIEVKNYFSTGMEIFSHGVTLKNSRIHNNALCTQCPGGQQHGVYATGADNLFENNLVYDNGGYGFHILYSGSGSTTMNSNTIVRNNRIFNNGRLSSVGGSGGFGIILASGTNLQAYNNVIWRNGRGIGFGGGIQISGCASCIVSHNTIYDNASAGIQLLAESYPVTNTVVKNNIFWLNGSGSIEDIGSTNTNKSNNLCASIVAGCSVASDPLFTAPGSTISADFTLQSGSPAINAGVTLTAPFNVDFAGNVRPTAGTAWDIGAYEFGSAPQVTHVLTFGSSNPASGCAITSVPNDIFGSGSGNTPNTWEYNAGTVASLTAALTCGGNDFQKWQKGGVDYTSAANANVTMDAAYTLTAFYVAPAQVTHVISIASVAPGSGARISVSPNDNAGANSCTTGCTRTYNTGTSVTITARPTSNAPIIWYQLDAGSGTSAVDSSSGLTATLENGVTWVAGDGSPYAVSLDGNSHFLQTPNSNLMSNLPALAVAARVKPTNAMSTWKAVVVKNYVFGLYASIGDNAYCGNGGVLGFVVIAAVTYTVCDPAPLPAGAFTRLRVICDPTGPTLNLVRNGTAFGTPTTVPSCDIANSTGVLQIGASEYGENFAGTIDDVRIYGIAVADDDNPGNAFASWAGCDDATVRVCTVAASSDKTVTATYAASGVALGLVGIKIYDLGFNLGVPVDITSSAKVMKGGSATFASQIDATIEDPPFTTLEFRYNKDGGEYAALPDTCVTPDWICWHGTADMRSNVPAVGTPVTCCLSGALTGFSGTTTRSVASAPSFDIAQDASIVLHSQVHFTSSASGIYCGRWYRSNGDPLDSYGATGCVTVSDYNSSGM